MRTTFAYEFVGEETTKVPLDDKILPEWFEFGLQLIHESGPKLIDIHLLHDVNGALVGT